MLGVTLPAYGQTGAERTAEARDAARIRLGPFYLTPSISLENIGYDTNVFLDPETREPQSDFVVTITPALRAALPIASRALVTFDLAPRGEYYRRLSNARSFAPQGAVLGEVFSPRFDLIGEGSLHSGRRRPSFEIEQRVDFTNTMVAGGLRYRPRSRLDFELTAFRTSTSFQDELFEEVNLDESLTRQNLGLRLTATRRLTSKTSASISVERSSSEFAVSSEKNGTTLVVSPGLSFTANALIAGQFNIGWLKFTPEKEALPEFAGVVADVDLSYTLRQATRFAVRWRRDLNYSFEPLQPYYLLRGLGASVRRQVVGRVDLILAFDQFESSYRSLLEMEAPAARVDISQTYSGDLGMRLNRQSRVGFRVATVTRESNQRADRNYRGIQMGLSYHYGM